MARPAGQAHADVRGTPRGYYWHSRTHTVACRACLRAWSAYAKEQRDRGRCAPGLGWPLADGKEASRG